jgi:hypothetical protein
MGVLRNVSLMSIGAVVLTTCLLSFGLAVADEEPFNLLQNPSFESGITGWSVNNNDITAATYVVDKKDSIDGKQSVLATVDVIGGWGSNFYQGGLPAGKVGDEYTFSVLAKSEGGPVTITLSVERGGDPWDKVARETVTFGEDEWTELYMTFVVGFDCPEGWTPYINCAQPKAEFRVDLFRLYEGEYVPYEELKPPRSVSASANSLVTTWGEVRAQD